MQPVGDRAPPQTFSLATFILTRKCPISCPMCFFACGPQRKEMLDRDLALRVLEEVRRLGIHYVGITGGEPTLHMARLTEMIEQATSYGLEPIVVTNAFWGFSQKFALQRLEVLHNSGLRWIQVSVDDQHQSFIPIERVANVLRAASELGFEDIKVLGSSQGNSGNFKYHLVYLQQVLGISMDRIDILDRPRISHQYFEDVDQERYPFTKLGDPSSSDVAISKPGDCLTELMLDVDGSLYPCCNNFVGRIGNAFETSIAKACSSLQTNQYFRILRRTGPFALATYLDEHEGSHFTERQYGSWCELCARIFQDCRFRNLLVGQDGSGDSD